MQITEIDIRHFRSLKKFTWNPLRCNVICGVNSSGKSNIRRALQFAFRESYDAAKVNENVCFDSLGPRTAVRISLTFDKPTQALATKLKIPLGAEFTYTLQVRRSGSFTASINSVQLTEAQRLTFLSEVLVVYVPPLRDLESNGLQPFVTTLTSALLKMRSAQSFNARAKSLVSVVREKGAQLLQATRGISRSQLRVDQLVVDVDKIDLTKAFNDIGLKFKIGSREQSLDKLGTGHQSAVILELYRQLGETADKFVLYLFEEPDNHLHLTSMRAMMDDLELCAKRPNSQVFITTHSAHLLNMLPIESHLCVTTENRLTERRVQKIRKTERQMRDAVSRSGLKIAEALLSRKVLLVEGPGDITLFRTLIELQTGATAEEHDIHIVAGTGKDGVTSLAAVLQDLGSNYSAVFDWDASLDTSFPMFKSLGVTDRANMIAYLSAVESHLRPLSANRKTKSQKTIDGLLSELRSPPAYAADFKRSQLGAFLNEVHGLTPSSVDAVGASLKKGIRTYRPELAKHRAWLWSASPEEILIPDHAAEIVAANEFVTMGVLQSVPVASALRRTVIKHAHELAHQPEQQVRLIQALWNAGVVRKSEIKSAVDFCL
jgi:predicted ATPase/chloramphenicol 3-O-phosphotransferase